jgi:hypothetical protein
MRARSGGVRCAGVTAGRAFDDPHPRREHLRCRRSGSTRPGAARLLRRHVPRHPRRPDPAERRVRHHQRAARQHRVVYRRGGTSYITDARFSTATWLPMIWDGYLGTGGTADGHRFDRGVRDRQRRRHDTSLGGGGLPNPAAGDVHGDLVLPRRRRRTTAPRWGRRRRSGRTTRSRGTGCSSPRATRSASRTSGRRGRDDDVRRDRLPPGPGGRQGHRARGAAQRAGGVHDGRRVGVLQHRRRPDGRAGNVQHRVDRTRGI